MSEDAGISAPNGRKPPPEFQLRLFLLDGGPSVCETQTGWISTTIPDGH
jgi:hypothetical protein